MISIEQFLVANPDYLKNYFAQGYFAKCYKLGDSKVYKKYKEPLSNRDLIFGNLMYLQRTKLDFEHIIFPNDLVVNNVFYPDTIHGCELNYIPELTYFSKMKIELILKMIEALEKEIIRLSKEYFIMIQDVNSDNILINDNGIYIIDTDFFRRRACNHSLERSNLQELNYEIFKKITKRTLHEKIEISRALEELYEDTINGQALISQFLKEYIKHLEQLSEQEIETVYDLKTSMLRRIL